MSAHQDHPKDEQLFALANHLVVEDDESAYLQGHVATCATCKARSDSLAGVLTPIPEQAPTPQIRAALMDAIDREDAADAAKAAQSRKGGGGPLGLLLALMVVGFATTMAVRWKPEPLQEQPAAPAKAPVAEPPAVESPKLMQQPGVSAPANPNGNRDGIAPPTSPG